MATPPVKRSYDVHDIEVTEGATVHGQVIELSPLKKSKNRENCKYFQGRISDGYKTARFISFEPNLRPTIEKFKNEESPIALSNCRIQNNKYDSSLEILTSRFSTIEQSPKKFKLPDGVAKNDVIDINEIQSTAVNQHISIIGKIIKVEEVVEVNTRSGKHLMKQDCTIKDATSSVRVVLWEEDVNRFIKGRCYKLMNVLTRQYEGAKYISFCDGSSIEQMDQIDGISSEEEDYDEVNHLQSIEAVTDGQIISVLSTTDYLSCVACSGSIIHISDTLAKCTKCHATMKISNCTSCKYAKLLILDSLKKKWNLTAYNEQLEDIIQEASGDSLEEKLLNSSKFTLQYYTATNVIKSVKH